jgi:transposase
MALKEKYVVRLTADDRRQLERLVSSGRHPARVLTRARILLRADAGDGGPGWDDARVAEALECGDRTVARVRRRYADGGLDAALHSRRPTGRQYRKLDGHQEAKLIALACSDPPGGRGRWTMKLLADRLVELAVVESIDPATVWRTLKKTTSSRG